jgi:hypothetical protein
MNLWQTLGSYPLTALAYDLGVILLGISMLNFSGLLRRMLETLKEPPIWILPFVGATALFISAVMHAVASAYLLPHMDTLKSATDLQYWSDLVRVWRTFSLSGIFLGGALSLIAGGLYYRWTSR